MTPSQPRSRVGKAWQEKMEDALGEIQVDYYGDNRRGIRGTKQIAAETKDKTDRWEWMLRGALMFGGVNFIAALFIVARLLGWGGELPQGLAVEPPAIVREAVPVPQASSFIASTPEAKLPELPTVNELLGISPEGLVK